MQKYLLLKLLFVLCLAVCFCEGCTTQSTESNDNKTITAQSDSITVRVYEVAGGWGYKILIHEKIKISQDFIPAVSGKNPFKTKEKALRTGQYAAEKMRTTQQLPTLTVEELEFLDAL